VNFTEAWSRRRDASCADVPIHVISPEDLIHNKETVGREQDLIDARSLRKALSI